MILHTASLFTFFYLCRQAQRQERLDRTKAELNYLLDMLLAAEELTRPKPLSFRVNG